jgi:hypothetical protein
MHGEPIATILSVRPALTPWSRTLLEAVFLAHGPVGSMAVLAGRIGLRNRFELDRILRRDGMPPLHRLAGWVTVLSWVEQSEREGTSLCQLAYRSHRHPSACYRLVRVVTGLRWQEVRARGCSWVQQQLLHEFLGRSPKSFRYMAKPTL